MMHVAAGQKAWSAQNVSGRFWPFRRLYFINVWSVDFSRLLYCSGCKLASAEAGRFCSATRCAI